jgi:hypothetical protein
MARTAGTGSRSSAWFRRRWCVSRVTSFDSLPNGSNLCYFTDNRSDGEDDEDRDFSQINALSSPASTPPQVELPDSPDLAEKINGPSASAIVTVEPLRLLSSEVPEGSLSHRTSASADDVEADLIPDSPTPSLNASQNTNTNSSQESSLRPNVLSSHSPPVFARAQFPSSNFARFRRGVFQAHYTGRISVRPEPRIDASQNQNPLAASQTLRSPVSSQTNGHEMSWLNTQAFRPLETQDSYESD